MDICFQYLMSVHQGHGCSADAACNNTKGSYLCSCLPGFSGGMGLCEGEMFYKTNTGDESTFLRKQFQSIYIVKSINLIKTNRIMLEHNLNEEH